MVKRPDAVRQVGAIQSVQVDIENEMKDQRETRRNEERKLRHWHKETAKKREQIAAAFADGAQQHSPSGGRNPDVLGAVSYRGCSAAPCLSCMADAAAIADMFLDMFNPGASAALRRGSSTVHGGRARRHGHRQGGDRDPIPGAPPPRSLWLLGKGQTYVTSIRRCLRRSSTLAASASMPLPGMARHDLRNLCMMDFRASHILSWRIACYMSAGISDR